MRPELPPVLVDPATGGVPPLPGLPAISAAPATGAPATGAPAPANPPAFESCEGSEPQLTPHAKARRAPARSIEIDSLISLLSISNPFPQISEIDDASPSSKLHLEHRSMRRVCSDRARR
jgi:hypothetical protein